MPVRKAEVLQQCSRFIAVKILVQVKRAAELQFREAKSVAEAIGDAGQALEFFAATRVEQVPLAGGGRKRRERDADETEQGGSVPGAVKKSTDRREQNVVQIRRLRQCVTSGDRFEIGESQGQSHGAGVQARIAQAFRGFLAQMAEGRLQFPAIISVLAESAVV